MANKFLDISYPETGALIDIDEDCSRLEQDGDVQDKSTLSAMDAEILELHRALVLGTVLHCIDRLRAQLQPNAAVAAVEAFREAIQLAIGTLESATDLILEDISGLLNTPIDNRDGAAAIPSGVADGMPSWQSGQDLSAAKKQNYHRHALVEVTDKDHGVDPAGTRATKGQGDERARKGDASSQKSQGTEQGHSCVVSRLPHHDPSY